MASWYAVALVAMMVMCLVLGVGTALGIAIMSVSALGAWLEG